MNAEPIRIEKYTGQTQEETLRLFAEHAASVQAAGYKPTNQTWEGTSLLVTYQHPESPPAPPEPPVTISGPRAGQSRPFFLRGRSYNVTWVGISETEFGCSLGLDLEASGEDFFSELIVATDIPGNSRRTGTAYVDNVDPGRYFVEANANCAWEATIEPTF